jgi:hypothetical protein
MKAPRADLLVQFVLESGDVDDPSIDSPKQRKRVSRLSRLRFRFCSSICDCKTPRNDFSRLRFIDISPTKLMSGLSFVGLAYPPGRDLLALRSFVCRGENAFWVAPTSRLSTPRAVVSQDARLAYLGRLSHESERREELNHIRYRSEQVNSTFHSSERVASN